MTVTIIDIDDESISTGALDEHDEDMYDYYNQPETLLDDAVGDSDNAAGDANIRLAAEKITAESLLLAMESAQASLRAQESVMAEINEMKKLSSSGVVAGNQVVVGNEADNTVTEGACSESLPSVEDTSNPKQNEPVENGGGEEKSKEAVADGKGDAKDNGEANVKDIGGSGEGEKSTVDSMESVD